MAFDLFSVIPEVKTDEYKKEMRGIILSHVNPDYSWKKDGIKKAQSELKRKMGYGYTPATVQAHVRPYRKFLELLLADEDKRKKMIKSLSEQEKKAELGMAVRAVTSWKEFHLRAQTKFGDDKNFMLLAEFVRKSHPELFQEKFEVKIETAHHPKNEEKEEETILVLPDRMLIGSLSISYRPKVHSKYETLASEKKENLIICLSNFALTNVISHMRYAKVEVPMHIRKALSPPSKQSEQYVSKISRTRQVSHYGNLDAPAQSLISILGERKGSFVWKLVNGTVVIYDFSTKRIIG